MKSKKRISALLSCLLCFSILFSSASYYGTAFAATNTEDIDAETEADLKDLNSKYSQLEKEQQKIQAQVNSAKTEKQKKLAVKKQLDNQISLTKEQISVLSQRINLLTGQISDMETQVADKEAEIEENYQKFLKRMRVMYMKGDASMVGLVLGADTFSEFLMQSELVKRLAEHDQELINGLVDDKTEIEDMLAQIEADKQDVESSKQTMAEKEEQLSGQSQQANQEIQNIAAMEKEFLANLSAKQAEMKQVQNELAEIYKNIGSIGDYVGGVMGWPLPGYSQISSEYGLRFGGSDNHTGIDITGGGVNGKSIVAANSGQVAVVNNTYVQGKGYGKYLIIDHGGNMSTLYAHTSQILVSVGDTVTRGQVIAKVGSTGWSTGPHLHFEVRQNGKPVNPWSYLK